MNDDQFDELLRGAARSYREPPEVPREAMWARIEAARSAPTLAPAGARWWRTAAGLAAVLVVGVAIGRMSRDMGVREQPAARVATARGAATPPAVAQPGTPEPVAEAPAREEDARPSARRNETRLAARLPAGTDRGAPRLARPTPGILADGTEITADRLAVVDHLARTEVLLTGFRADVTNGRRPTREDAQQFGALSRELLQNTRLLLATHATDDPTLTRLLQDLELVLMQISQYAAEGGARRGDLEAINQSLDRRNVLPKLRSTIPAGAPAPAGT